MALVGLMDVRIGFSVVYQRTGKVFHPEERITRDEALRMYTNGSAWLQFDEAKKGSIEKGKFADLTIIDRDFETTPDMRDIHPVMVIVNGKIAWQREAE